MPVGRQSRLTATVPPGPVGRPTGPASGAPARSAPAAVSRCACRTGRRVGLAHDQALGLEAGEAIGQDVGRDPVEVGEQVAESAGPRQQCGDDQQGPPVADALGRLGQGIGGGRLGNRGTGRGRLFGPTGVWPSGPSRYSAGWLLADC